MSSDKVIEVNCISKCYHIYDKPSDRLLQMLCRGRKKLYDEFWALKDVSFTLSRGETVGIVGRNGSGKSTLLQLICGTLLPTTGYVRSFGRVAALLELGAGFNPEFTGIENVYMSASLYGLTDSEIDQRLDSILKFADIGDYVYQPVKSYSSGMYVRLAFSVVAHVDADILIVDEALAVGDAFFTQKCMRFLRRFMKHGSVLFVSHDTGAVVNLCNRAILLNNGLVEMIGSPKEVSQKYLASIYANQETEEDVESSEMQDMPKDKNLDYKDFRENFINNSKYRNDIELFQFENTFDAFGEGGASISSIKLLDEKLQPLSWIVGGEDVILEIVVKAEDEIKRPIIGFDIRDRLGQIIFRDNTNLASVQPDCPVREGDSVVAKFNFRLPVLPTGDYVLSAAIADGTQEEHRQLQWMFDAFKFKVHSSSACFGLIGLAMKDISLTILNE